jgi:3-methyladenine DNA glycosylase AlkC
MAESREFRDVFDRSAVQFLADRIAGVQRSFDPSAFVEQVVRDLPPLSLTGRSDRITRGLRDHLPGDFARCIATLRKAVGPDDGTGGIEGMGGFRYLPILNFVSTYGLEEPDLSLDALQHFTRYFSGEFAIRHFIVRHPRKAMSAIRRWAADSDWRVRRLASEGTRPRLPWGVRLKAFVVDPSPVIELLETMRDEPHETVQRSIANNLNDISRDHPQRVVDMAGRWVANATPDRQKLVRHALRTLIKQGHAGALSALGFACETDAIKATPIKLSAKRIRLGEAIGFSLTLQNSGKADARLSIDYVVHHVRANGRTTPKVFKLAQRTLTPGEKVFIERSHAIVPITTRRYYAGRHKVEVIVNGVVVAGAEFDLTLQ